MKKSLFLWFFTFVLVGCVSIPSIYKVKDTPLEHIYESFLVISCGSPLSFYYNIASATVIEKGIAVASLHSDRGFYSCGDSFLAKTVYGDEFIVHVLAYSSNMDIVYLKVPDSVKPADLFSVSLPVVGDNVWAIGAPGIGTGIVASQNEIVDLISSSDSFKGLKKVKICGQDAYELEGLFSVRSGNITYGYSGGPVVDKEGKLIGISESILAFSGDCVNITPFSDGAVLVYVHPIIDILKEFEKMELGQ